ncbi:GTP-binding protein [Schleiferia thermophila]|uniref:GTP-binding protein n=2 Tax=Schleiferia thermophila TaxID=884107 RepID=UPI00056A37C5
MHLYFCITNKLKDLDPFNRMPDKLIKIAIAGSTDDGKSTLLGRFLMDTHNVPDDQLQSIAEESKRLGRPAPEIAWLTDGLSTEQQKLITIDVAYRSVNLNGIRFQLIDTPGHLEFLTRAAVGISEADSLVLITDISRSITDQTIRHLILARMFGINRLIVVVNKMDIVDWKMQRFCDFQKALTAKFSLLFPGQITYIPVSALSGHNVVFDSGYTQWYQGPTLFQCFLNLADQNVSRLKSHSNTTIARIAWYRPDLKCMGMKILSGILKSGEELFLKGSEKSIIIQSIFYHGIKADTAFMGQSITVLIEGEFNEIFEGICSKKPLNYLSADIVVEAVLFEECNNKTLKWVTHAGNFDVTVEILTDLTSEAFECEWTTSADSFAVFKRLRIHAYLPEGLPSYILNRGLLFGNNKKLVAITGREIGQ